MPRGPSSVSTNAEQAPAALPPTPLASNPKKQLKHEQELPSVSGELHQLLSSRLANRTMVRLVRQELPRSPRSGQKLTRWTVLSATA